MGGGVADGGGLTRITGAKEGSLCSQPSCGTTLLPPSLNLLNPLRPPSHYWGGKRERKTSSKRKKRRRKEGSPLVCPPSTPFPSLPFIPLSPGRPPLSMVAPFPPPPPKHEALRQPRRTTPPLSHSPPPRVSPQSPRLNAVAIGETARARPRLRPVVVADRAGESPRPHASTE